jgi:hypothetical protein
LATFSVTVDQHITVQALTHTSSAGVLLHSSGAWTITVTAWQANTVNTSQLINVSGGVANLVGNFVGGSSSGRLAINVASGGTATIADANGGTGSGSHCVNVASGGTATITNATGGSVGAGVLVASGGTATITNATGGSLGPGASVLSGGTATITNATASTAVEGAISASTTTRVLGALTSASNGRLPIAGTWLLDDAATVTLTAFNTDNWPSAAGDPITLSVQGASNPNADDVREGVAFGAGGALTGTLAVPPPASVAAGVPTDDTVGTAALGLADVLAGTGAQIAAATSG